MKAKYAKPLTNRGRKTAIRHKHENMADALLGSFQRGVNNDPYEGSTGYDRFFSYEGDHTRFLREELQTEFAPKINELIDSVRKYPITIAQSCNSYGKTHAAAHIGISFLSTFPESQVYTAAAPPESNLKLLLWGEIGRIVEKYEFKLFDGYKNVSLPSMVIERHAKCGMYGLTIPTVGTEENREARFGGKHAPFILFIIDEADAVPDEIFRAIESCLSGGFARLLCMFNPRRESGAVYQLISNHQANVVKLDAFSHPNVIEGHEVYPGAVSRDTTVRRINLWTEPLGEHDLPAADCFLVPDFLVGFKAARTDGGFYPPLPAGYRRIIAPEFSYMVLAEYPTMSEGQLIDKVWIERARDRGNAYRKIHGNTPVFHIKPYMGFDIAETTDMNAVTFRYGGYACPAILWTGIDIPASSDRGSRFYHQRNAEWVNVDANGLGAACPKLMERNGCNARGIKAQEGTTENAGEDYGEFERMRDQGWWAMREWLRCDPNAMLPDDPKLLEELKVATYERNEKNGKIKVASNNTMREKLPQGRSPDRATSLMLTFCPPPEEEAPGDLYASNYAFSPGDDGPRQMVGLDME